MPFQVGIPLLGLLLASAGGFALGWKTKGAFVDSAELQAQKAREVVLVQLRERENAIADQLAKRMAAAQFRERVIERERIKIVDRPVYNNVCLDDDGVRLINRARAAQGDTTKPIDPVPPTK